MASPDPSISTLPTSVASYGGQITTVQFNNVEELLQTIDAIAGDYLVVTNVFPDDFAQIDLSREKRPPSLLLPKRPQGHPNGDGAEGDSTGGPQPERRMKGAWPTLVIEAGDFEPLSELNNDMRWWFSASDHQVKIVLLAKFEHTHREIILEKWEEEPQTRQGATMTRQATAISSVALLRPILQ
ncbi:hypothetical protein BX600DRAFT_437821 [Xylariales sp. PMI_506]|nr:hypothetical protein BX600DRAFT_437821 [Xylariales sp. PMI_506]